MYYRLLWILSIKYNNKEVIEVDFSIFFFLSLFGFSFPDGSIEAKGEDLHLPP